MATRYAFSQSLKELRFHLCQTSEHSAALRYANWPSCAWNRG
jgi:NADH dehydrogenase (ubiquinone) 1 alpha subcomplex subunit 2